MDKLKQIHKTMQALDNKSVKVGIMEGEYPDGTPVVDVAIYNEFGTTKMPPRAFMRQAESESKEQLKAVQKHLVEKAQQGLATADEVLETTGQWYQSRVQSEITDGDFAANKASTIRKKGSSNPLIDTGLLRTSVRYKKS